MSDDKAAARAEEAARRAEEAARQARELAEKAAREEAIRNQEIRDAGRGGDGDQPGKTKD